MTIDLGRRAAAVDHGRHGPGRDAPARTRSSPAFESGVIVSGEDRRFARRDRDRSTANTCQLAPTDERLSSAGSSVTPSRARRRAGDDESSRQRNRLARLRSGASRRRRRDLVAELHAHHPSRHARTSREAE